MDNTKIKKIILTIISAMLLISIIINYVQFIQFMVMKNLDSDAWKATNDYTYIVIFIGITLMLFSSLFIFVTDFIDFEFKNRNEIKKIIFISLIFLEILLIILTIIYLSGYQKDTPNYGQVSNAQTSTYLYISAILIPLIVSAGLLDVTLISTSLIDGSFKLTKTKESDD